jgi:hypothetical protein
MMDRSIRELWGDFRLDSLAWGSRVLCMAALDAVRESRDNSLAPY